MSTKNFNHETNEYLRAIEVILDTQTSGLSPKQVVPIYETALRTIRTYILPAVESTTFTAVIERSHMFTTKQYPHSTLIKTNTDDFDYTPLYQDTNAPSIDSIDALKYFYPENH